MNHYLDELRKHRGHARRTLIMGVLNVTPDSFSDGGKWLSPEAAAARAMEMEKDGADLIDIGAESTRPGSEPVSEQEQIDRLLPVLDRLNGRLEIPVSVDTYNSRVARDALDHGASIINDISAVRFDPEMAALAAQRSCPLILMHIQGTPRDMQKNPVYDDVVAEVRCHLREQAEQAMAAGVVRENIILDPGLGFGKKHIHNLKLLNNLPELTAEGFPILIGASRKSLIGHVLDAPVEDRLEGTLAVSALCTAAGADILRVHDVKENLRVVQMTEAVIREQVPVPTVSG